MSSILKRVAVERIGDSKTGKITGALYLADQEEIRAMKKSGAYVLGSIPNEIWNQVVLAGGDPERDLVIIVNPATKVQYGYIDSVVGRNIMETIAADARKKGQITEEQARKYILLGMGVAL